MHLPPLRATPFWRDALLIAAFLLLVVNRVFFLGPRVFGPDEAFYATQAHAWREGLIPCRDTWDTKPPGMAFIYLLLARLTGGSMSGVHAASLLALLLTAFLLLAIARNCKVEQRFLPVMIALFAILTSTSLPIGDAMSLTASIPQTLLVTAAVGLLLRGGITRRASYCCLAGVLTALAMQVRPSAMIVWLPLLPLLALPSGKDLGIGGRLRLPLASIAGLAVGFLPIVLYYGKLGALAELWKWSCVHGLEYSFVDPATLVWRAIRGCKRYIMAFPIPVGLSIVGLIWVRRETTSAAAWPRRFLLIWTYASLASLLPGWHFYRHYFMQMAPVVAILAGIGFSRIVRSSGGKRPALLGGSILFLAVLLPTMVNLRSSRRALAGAFSPEEAVANYITRHSRPEDRVFAWPWKPQIYYYSRRLPAVRGIDPSFYTASESRAGAHLQEYQETLLIDLQRTLPRYIAIASRKPPFGRLQLLLDQGYRLERMVSDYKIYRRK